MIKYEPFFSSITKMDPVVRENLYRIQKALASVGESSSSSASARSVSRGSSSPASVPVNVRMKYAGMRYPSPEWTLNGSAPNIRIPAGKCYLYDNENWQGYIQSYDVPENEFTLTLNADQVVIVDYNGGSPVYALANGTPRPWNFSDKIGVYRFWWDGVTIHSESTDSLGEGLPEKEAIRTALTGFYARAYDEGVILGVSNTPVNHTATISAGYMFAGSILETLGAFNSSTDTFTRYVKNAGVWTPSNVTTYNTTHYNDNAGLVVASAGKYLVDWVYRSVGNAVQSFSVLGTAAYNTAAEAKASVRRTDVPPVVSKHCVLVGRYIVKVGATTGEVESVYTEAFSFGGVTNHNDLTGIQDASPAVSGEHYHLSADQADHASKLAANWDMNIGSQQPATDNAVDVGYDGAVPKRVRNVYAMVLRAATGIYRAGLELASVFAPVSHASNSTTYGIASASDYGHVKSSTTNPHMDGVADPGTAGALVANYNHRHPTDTTREAVWGRTTITASSNFNDYVSPGVHKVSNAAAATDFPPGAYGYGSLAVFVYGAGELVQVYFPHRSGGVSNAGMRMRVRYGGSWHGWVIIQDTSYLATVFASKDSVNAFSQMNTFNNRVVHSAPPEYPVRPNGTTSGNITWDNDVAEILTLTTALTGSTTVVITNQREGRITYLRYLQGSTKRTVMLSATGVTFWTPGSPSGNVDALAISGNDVASQLSCFRLIWHSTSLVTVAREMW